MNLMSKSWKLFTALGVPVRIHISFLAILGFIVATNLAFVPIFLILIASILVHEYGHVLAGRRFGNDCSVIYLHLLGGAAMMRRSKSLKEDWVVAIAGPAADLGLFVMFTGLYLLFRVDILLLAAQLNLIIAVFNLAPVYPMDGGRIYKAIMEYLFGENTGTTIAIYTARVISIAVGIWALMNGFYVLAMIAVAILLTGNAEQAATRGRR